MLEDESGRIALVGERINKAYLVTGVIIAALGIETPAGEFEVADICFAGLPHQPIISPELQRDMDIDGIFGSSQSCRPSY